MQGTEPSISEHQALVDAVRALGLRYVDRGSVPFLALGVHRGGGDTIWHGSPGAYVDHALAQQAVERLQAAMEPFPSAVVPRGLRRAIRGLCD